MSPEIARIRADLAKARQRAANVTQGDPTAWDSASSTKLGLPNGAARWEAQVTARQADIARLESELVYALLPVWGAARVLAAMGET